MASFKLANAIQKDAMKRHFSTYIARRPTWLKCFGGVVLLFLAVLPILPPAAAYPDRPIRMIIPLPPGGAVDIVARLLQPYLEKAFGQSIVIDNRSGASGI